MHAWEYTVLTFEILGEAAGWHDGEAERDALIAELGAAGWELVTVVPLSLNVSLRTAATTHERWVFKRPRDRTGVARAAVEEIGDQEETTIRVRSDEPPISGMREIRNPHVDENAL